MPAAILHPILHPSVESDSPPRIRFTRALVDQMLDAGLFEGQRFELIDGDIIDKMGQNPPHATGVNRMLIYLIRVFGVEHIRVQQPIEVAREDRELCWPEPDLTVVAEAKADYETRHPAGTELTLLVEVADTSVRFDATRKRDLYARAGVPEYWVLDVSARQLIVHRNPTQGAYQQISTLSDKEMVAVESQPDQPIPVSGLLPRS